MARFSTDPAFRATYVKNNEISTLRRFGSLDTRSPGVDEDPAPLSPTPDKSAGKATLKDKEEPPPKAKSAPAPVKKPEPAAPAKRDPSSKTDVVDAKTVAKSKVAAPPPEASAKSSKPAAPVDKEAAAAAEAEAKERRREEETRKAREAEERKRRAAEKKAAKAEQRRKREAEEVAKKKDKVRALLAEDGLLSPLIWSSWKQPRRIRQESLAGDLFACLVVLIVWWKRPDARAICRRISCAVGRCGYMLEAAKKWDGVGRDSLVGNWFEW
jgi:hypothetical protein